MQPSKIYYDRCIPRFDREVYGAKVSNAARNEELHRIIFNGVSPRQNALRYNNLKPKLVLAQRKVVEKTYGCESVRILDAPDFEGGLNKRMMDCAGGILGIILGTSAYQCNKQTGEVNEIAEYDSEPLTSIKFIVEGRYLAIGDSTEGIDIWDIAKRKRIRTMRNTDCLNTVMGVFNKDDPLLKVGNRGGNLSFFDVRAAQPKVWENPSAHAGEILGMAVSDDGHTIATSGTDKVVKIWDCRGNSTISTRNYTEHESLVRDIAFCPWDSKRIATADTSLRIWNSLNGDTSVVNKIGTQVTNLIWNKEQRQLVFTCGREIRLWENKFSFRCGEGHIQPIADAVMFSDQQIATVSDDETLRIWKIWEDQKPKEEMKPILPLAFAKYDIR